jgi:hypothetical protein
MFGAWVAKPAYQAGFATLFPTFWWISQQAGFATG